MVLVIGMDNLSHYYSNFCCYAKERTNWFGTKVRQTVYITFEAVIQWIPVPKKEPLKLELKTFNAMKNFSSSAMLQNSILSIYSKNFSSSHHLKIPHLISSAKIQQNHLVAQQFCNLYFLCVTRAINLLTGVPLVLLNKTSKFQSIYFYFKI